MTETDQGAPELPAPEDIRRGWQDMTLRVAQLEAEKRVLEQESKSLRRMLELVIEQRQKSHGELVLLLTSLVSKLPLNDVGVIISRLVEHNNNVSHFLSGLIKGTPEDCLEKPSVLLTLEQTKRQLQNAVKPLVDELIKLEMPIETDALQALVSEPESFFSPRMVRATRCYVKGQVPKERVLRTFGEEALPFLNDLTTDPRLNPRPKSDEIVLAFKSDFEALLGQNPGALGGKRQDLLELHCRVQASRANTEQARAQRNAFTRLSFVIELLHYYEHQNTEAPEVPFVQRLPALIEQLVVPHPRDPLDEKLIAQAEHLISFVINPDHQQSIVNNVGKGGGTARTVRYVLKLRSEKVPDQDHVVTEFVKHLIPAPPEAPPEPPAIAAILKHIHPRMQVAVTRAILNTDRMRKDLAEVLSRKVAAELGLKAEEIKGTETVSPDVERQIAWTRIRELVVRRSDPALVANAMRERLTAKYEAEEIRHSWLVLTEADPILLIRVFCHLPYLPSGKTDPIARPVMETYVSRLSHEKYASTYHKVVNSLRNMFRAKPDSPTLLNFLALVRWISPEVADKISADIGMAVAAKVAG